MDLVTLLPFLLIIAFFWLIVVRPARNRQRTQAQLLSNLMPGQQVMTTSGLFATVVAVEDDALVLETSPGITSRWAKAAVSRIIPADSDVEDPDGEQPDGADDVRPPTA